MELARAFGVEWAFLRGSERQIELEGLEHEEVEQAREGEQEERQRDHQCEIETARPFRLVWFTDLDVRQLVTRFTWRARIAFELPAQRRRALEREPPRFLLHVRISGPKQGFLRDARGRAAVGAGHDAGAGADLEPSATARATERNDAGVTRALFYACDELIASVFVLDHGNEPRAQAQRLGGQAVDARVVAVGATQVEVGSARVELEHSAAGFAARFAELRVEAHRARDLHAAFEHEPGFLIQRARPGSERILLFDGETLVGFAPLGRSGQVGDRVGMGERLLPGRLGEGLIEPAAQAAHRAVEVQVIEGREVSARATLELGVHLHPIQDPESLHASGGLGYADALMGRFIDVGQEATGFIAIGQFATGFFAIGQVATGVIAIGQLARGFFVVGQAAFGVLSVGMLSGGLVGAVGMIGAGGRGVGFVLPLVPRFTAPITLPETTTFLELSQSGSPEGWVSGSVEVMPDGRARVYAGDAPLPVRIDARLRRALPAESGRKVLICLRRQLGGAYVADGIMNIPAPRITNWRWWVIWAVQLSLLSLAALALWLFALRPVLDALERLF